MKLDLMAGVVSKYGVDWIAYDSQAQIGIKDDVTSIKKYFLPNSVKEIVVDNPQAEFIELLKDLLIVKGEVTIRGHFSNPFFKMIYRHFTSSLSGFGLTLVEILEMPDPIVHDHVYHRTDGSELDKRVLKVIYLRK